MLLEGRGVVEAVLQKRMMQTLQNALLKKRSQLQVQPPRHYPPVHQAQSRCHATQLKPGIRPADSQKQEGPKGMAPATTEVTEQEGRKTSNGKVSLLTRGHRPSSEEGPWSSGFSLRQMKIFMAFLFAGWGRQIILGFAFIICLQWWIRGRGRRVMMGNSS